MERIREIVTELSRKYALDGENVNRAHMLAEFCDAVRELPIADDGTRAEAHTVARMVAAEIIGALVPEISTELAQALADRRISEAA